MVYMHVTLKIRYGKLDQFNEALGQLVPMLEGYGWKLVGAWQTTIGRLNTVVDLWQVPDANAVPSVLALAAENPEFTKYMPIINDAVEEEVLQIMVPTPYSDLKD